MKDREFLAQLHSRLTKYALSLDLYDLPRLKALIAATPEDRDSFGCTDPSVEERLKTIRKKYNLSDLMTDLTGVLEAMNKRLDDNGLHNVVKEPK